MITYCWIHFVKWPRVDGVHKLNWIIMMAVNDSSVQFGTLFINTRFWEVVALLKEVGFQATLELFFGQGRGGRMLMLGRLFQMTGATTLKLGETSFAEFRCCSWHGHISMVCRRLARPERFAVVIQTVIMSSSVYYCWPSDVSICFCCWNVIEKAFRN